MVTKWKNSAKKILGLFAREKRFLLGFVLSAFGLFGFFSMVAYRTYYPTSSALMLGTLGNLFLGAGICILLNRILKGRYENWLPVEENYYQEWTVSYTHLRAHET